MTNDHNGVPGIIVYVKDIYTRINSTIIRSTNSNDARRIRRLYFRCVSTNCRYNNLIDWWELHYFKVGGLYSSGIQGQSPSPPPLRRTWDTSVKKQNIAIVCNGTHNCNLPVCPRGIQNEGCPEADTQLRIRYTICSEPPPTVRL